MSDPTPARPTRRRATVHDGTYAGLDIDNLLHLAALKGITVYRTNALGDLIPYTKETPK